MELVGPRPEFNPILAVKHGFCGLVNCMPGWDQRDGIPAKLAGRTGRGRPGARASHRTHRWREGIELLIPRVRKEIRKDKLSGTLSSDALPR
jgi:hypothetical protein